MRVIADNSAEIEKHVTCKNCGILIGYLPNDTKEVKEYDYTGDFDIETVTKCPKCKKKVYV